MILTIQHQRWQILNPHSIDLYLIKNDIHSVLYYLLLYILVTHISRCEIDYQTKESDQNMTLVINEYYFRRLKRFWYDFVNIAYPKIRLGQHHLDVFLSHSKRENRHRFVITPNLMFSIHQQITHDNYKYGQSFSWIHELRITNIDQKK